jgi:hypothetical protein
LSLPQGIQFITESQIQGSDYPNISPTKFTDQIIAFGISYIYLKKLGLTSLPEAVSGNSQFEWGVQRAG